MTALPYTVRPLEPWVEPVTTDRRDSPFKTNTTTGQGWSQRVDVSWTSTLDLLDREIFMLGELSGLTGASLLANPGHAQVRLPGRGEGHPPRTGPATPTHSHGSTRPRDLIAAR